ncbi:hypothetical protein Hanom_Chr02g00147191 [Helianthus anomalus]
MCLKINITPLYLFYKIAEFPLFLDAPDNTNCRYFSKIQSILNC